MEAKQGRCVVLVPTPAQGHITPAMQLGKTLQSKGFSITVAQTKFNPISTSDDTSGFRFVTFRDNLPESAFKDLGLVELLIKLNEACETGFKDCLIRLLQQGDDIACVIYDEFMYSSESAAKQLKLPSVIFTTTNATAFLSRSVLGKVKLNGFLAPLKDSESQAKLVPEFHSLRFKDLPISAFASVEDSMKLYEHSGNRKTSVAVIVNTASCIESISLEQLHQEMQITVFPVGPLHIMSSAYFSLLKEDRSCIEWLNKQKPRSVLYISMGSLALMETKEVVEMACGLADSNQPFLWAIRPGSIPGSEWIEALPEEFSTRVPGRGYIVKWAPQKEVLAHSAVGGFWSHCGWNSTLESIGEGVPMICRPFSGDQKVNARYLDRVWRIGIHLEGELERGGVKRAVRGLMVDEEGAKMKNRVISLKEKLEDSVRKGGSSYGSLDQLVNFIKAL